MRSHPLVKLALLCALASGGGGKAAAQNPAEDLPRATIRISAFGAFGSNTTDPRVYLYTLDGKQNLAKNPKALTIKNVPYGSYLLVVSSSGGGVGRRLVSVNAPDLWLRVGVPMPLGETLWPGGNLAVVGEIKPAPRKAKNWWVRVAGVFLNSCREAPVQKDGTYRVAGLEMGRYLVEVFEGAELRHVQSIEIDPKTPVTRLTITLPN